MGIFDRIKPDAEDRLPVHLVTAAVYLAARGVFSDAQILTALNEKLNTPLDAAATADLAAMKVNATTGAAVARVDYLLRLEALGIGVEAGLLTNEATYRSEAGLV